MREPTADELAPVLAAKSVAVKARNAASLAHADFVRAMAVLDQAIDLEPGYGVNLATGKIELIAQPNG